MKYNKSTNVPAWPYWVLIEMTERSFCRVELRNPGWLVYFAT